MLKKILLGAAALTASATALPAAAEAQGYYRDSRYARNYDGYGYRGGYYDRGYYNRGYNRNYYGRGYNRNYYGRNQYSRNYRRCGSGTTGAIIGGAAGALLGREIARGDRRYGYRRGGNGTVGAIVGGGVGALLGREIGRSC